MSSVATHTIASKTFKRWRIQGPESAADSPGDLPLQTIRAHPQTRTSGTDDNENIQSRNDASRTVSTTSDSPPEGTGTISAPRLALLFLDFFIFGMNDGAYGALVPVFQEQYNLSYIVVSLIFLTPFAGYCLAALISSSLHLRYGQRGIAFVIPACRLLTYAVNLSHPPFPVIVVFFAFAGIGNGLADAAWNAYTGDMKHANQIMSIMHGFFGLGAMISPLIVTAIVQSYHGAWWYYYIIMVSLSVLDMAIGVGVFWKESGEEFRRASGGTANLKGRTRQAMKTKVTWICAALLLLYIGTEVSLGGWTATFMMQVREAGSWESEVSATGFWLGLTVGRLTLGFVTARVGERLAVSVYLVISVVLQLLLWLIPNFIASAVLVAFQGLAIAPLNSAIIVAMAKLIPKYLHVPSIGVASAVGGTGAAILPFVTGAIVDAVGVWTIQPIILSFLVGQFGFWMLLLGVSPIQRLQ